MVANGSRDTSFLIRFAEWLVVCAIALGLLIRARIISAAPLKPVDPGRWLLAGMTDDLAVTLALALLVAAIFFLAPRAGAVVMALAVTAMLVAQFALSEAVIALGHSLRGEDLETGFHPLLLTGSATGGLLAAALTVVAAGIVAAVFAWRMAQRGSRSPLTLSRLVAVMVVAFVASRLFPPPDASAARNAFIAAPSLLRYAAVEQPEPIIARPDVDIRLARELVSGASEATFISDQYPLAHLAPPRSPLAMTTPASPPLNVVVILLESMRAEEWGVYGNDPPGVTPNLDQIARDGIRVERAYSPGGFTPEGELSGLYGTLASPGETVMRAPSNVRLSGVPG